MIAATDQPAREFLAAQLQALKDLYAEFFMLMDGSVQEDPMTEQTGGLDKAIAALMETIDKSTAEFREGVARARAGEGLGDALSAEIAEFEDLLRAGLRIMGERIQARAAEFADARDQLKERLLNLRRKRQGAQGYRAYTRDRKLLDSSI